MKAKEWFGFVVRTVGLFLMLYSLFYFYAAIASCFSSELGRGGPPVYHAGLGLLMISVGFYLLRGAPHLMRLAYGEHKENPGDEESD